MYTKLKDLLGPVYNESKEEGSLRTLGRSSRALFVFFVITLVLELSDAKVYEP